MLHWISQQRIKSFFMSSNKTLSMRKLIWLVLGCFIIGFVAESFVNNPAPKKKKIGKMLGADISFLPQLEADGRKFYDKDVQKDAIEILKDHGFNYIRLRIFNNPEAKNGYSAKGYCGLEQTKMMAS